MPEKNLNINVRIKKTTNSSSSSKSTTEEDPKVQAARQKAADKEKLESLKATLTQKQSLLNADIKKTQTLLEAAKSRELEAERQGNRMKIKEAINYRKIMESQLRNLEADKRLSNSKDLAEFRENLRLKAAAEKQFQSSLRNAPRTKLSGDIGSLAYTRQIERSMGGMTAGTQEYVQSEALLKRYRAQLTAAGVDVRGLSEKIGGEFTNALNSSNKSMHNSVMQSGKMALGYAGVTVGALQLWNAMKQGTALLELKENFEGSAVQLENLRKSTMNTVSEGNIIKLSNQFSDLGVSLEEQVILFALSDKAGDRYGTGVEENIMKVMNATEGMNKGLKSLGIQKAKYEEVLKALVKTAGGEIEMIKGEGKEREISIKNLDAETQKRLRVQAIIQSGGITYEQALNQQANWNDTLQSSLVSLEDLWSYLGIALTAVVNFATPLGPLAKTIRDIRQTIATLPKEIENFDRAIIYLVNDIPLIGSSLSGTFESIGRFIGLLNDAQTAIHGLNSVSLMPPDLKGMRENFTGTYEEAIRGLVNAYGMSWEDAKEMIDKEFPSAKEHEAYAPTKSTTSTKSAKTQKLKEELNLIKLQEIELAKLNKQLAANLGDIGAELEIKEKILKVEEEIHRLRFGPALIEKRPEGRGFENQSGDSLGSFRGGYGRDAEIERAIRIQEIYNQIHDKQLSVFNQSFSIVQQIDGLLGGGASEILNAFQQAYSITQAIVELINTMKALEGLFDILAGLFGGEEAKGAIGVAMKAIPGLAGGGKAAAGTLYRWNEHGEELFISSGGGHVVTAGEFASLKNAISTMGAAMASQNRNHEYVNMYQGKMQKSNDTVIVKNYFSGELSALGSYKAVEKGNVIAEKRGRGEI